MKRKPLNDTRRAVLETIRMRLTEKEAMIYLEDKDIHLAHSQYYVHRRWLNKHKLERLHFIASIGFEHQHCDRIDTCETIDQLMWKEYRECKDPYKRVMILKEIKELQPYISSYYEATKDVISGSSQNGGRQENCSISKPKQDESNTSTSLWA